MRRNARARTTNLRCRIEVTVFAGVMLVLLFILMVIPPPVHDGRPIELAKTRHAIPMPGAAREDALIVAIQRDGKVFFDTTQVGPEDLPTRIKASLRLGAPGTIYVKADARARYHSVSEAVAEIRNAGMDRVVLLTERRSR